MALGSAYAAGPSSSDVSAQITAAVNSLVDAAPGTLDTLNELAAALGDDADFAATVTAALATKQDTLSDAEVKTKYESNSDTNAYTDAEKSKLSGIATGATQENITVSTDAPSGGNDGDYWFQREA